MVRQVVVACEHGFVVCTQFCCESFRHAHGTVLATGTSDGNGQITAMSVLEARDPAIEKSHDILIHRIEDLVSIQKLNDFIVEPAQFTQFIVLAADIQPVE